MQKKQSTNSMSQYFLEHAQDLIPEVLNNTCKINILTPSQIDNAAEFIKKNQLVAFPTETVYGLGANATNEKAILSIYETKKRPLSDPIIVHILNIEQAEELIQLDDEEKKLFRVLTNAFWPGPLTFIAKANLNKLPLIVTAGTGLVGLRSPKHSIARQLIQKSGLPIGAPSANLFGHVSPTESFHVVNDFYNQSISVIDGGRSQFGLESTVVKFSNGVLQVLREGSLTINKLEQVLRLSGLNIKVEVVKVTKKQNQNQQSPGQMFKHYSPNIPCYYLDSIQNQKQEKPSKQFKLDDSVFLSFSDQFQNLLGKAGYYFRVGSSSKVQQTQPLQFQQKFCTSQQKKVMQQVYYLLRKAENLGKKVIVIGWSDQKKGPIWDKISRATQNKKAIIVNDSLFV